VRRSFQACCAAFAAALTLATGVQTAAAADPSCPPAGQGEPLAVTAPQALAQLFELTEERRILSVTPVVADSAGGTSTVEIRSTVVTPAGIRVPAALLGRAQVTLGAAPQPVEVPLPTVGILAPGTYALVVDPPGASSAVAWVRCADESQGGARFRTALDSWIALEARLAFAVTGTVPDRTAPQTTITGAPPAFTRDTAVLIAFTADEPATFRCSLNGAAATPCASPLQLAPGEGAHTVRVTAVDDSGNADPTPATAAFAIDLTAPVLDLPETVNVWATGADGAGSVTYEAGAADALDPSPAVSCSPASGTGFPIGQTTVTCQASDAAGNVATGTFLVVVRTDPGRAEVSAQWNPGNGKIQVTEPGGGAIQFAPPVILATRGEHVTRVSYRGAYEYKRGRLNTYLHLRSIGYDGEPATPLRETFYSVCDATEYGDGTVRSAQITASAGKRAIVILYEASAKATRVMWVNGASKRYEKRPGLWVPRLVTTAGSARLSLVRPSSTGGAAVAATASNADAVGDALSALVVSDDDLAALADR
jgi:hypothetical protein